MVGTAQPHNYVSITNAFTQENDIQSSHATGRFRKTGNVTIMTGKSGNNLELNDFGPKSDNYWEFEVKKNICAQIF